MTRTIWIIGTLGALIAVAAGAFATHGLEQAGDLHTAQIVRTGALYGLVHSLALMILAVLRPLVDRGLVALDARLLMAAAGALGAGAILFPGSLYLYAATGWRPLVFVTPVGGTAFLIGWVLATLAALRRPRKR